MIAILRRIEKRDGNVIFKNIYLSKDIRGKGVVYRTKVHDRDWVVASFDYPSYASNTYASNITLMGKDHLRNNGNIMVPQGHLDDFIEVVKSSGFIRIISKQAKCIVINVFGKKEGMYSNLDAETIAKLADVKGEILK